MVTDDGARLEQDRALGRVVQQPVAHVHVVMVVGVEVPDRLQIRPACRHGRADHVEDGSGGRREADVGASEDPVALRREPPRSRGGEHRHRSPADGDDRRVLERGHHALEPVGLGGGIVVEVGDDATGRQLRRGGASGAEASRVPVLDNPNRYPAGRVSIAPAAQAPLVEDAIVVDREEQLARRVGLPEHRVDGVAQQLPSVHRVGADDDGHIGADGVGMWAIPFRSGHGCATENGRGRIASRASASSPGTPGAGWTRPTTESARIDSGTRTVSAARRDQ